MDRIVLHRPRNLDWKRAAALLYGDWGTSKAYVIGLAFMAAGFSSLPIILAICALTALVAYNYVIICHHFPEGGGVYSAARDQSRLLAITGAMLLLADLTVTASLSGWAALSYFGVPPQYLGRATIGVILIIGAINFFGPKHSGSMAVTLAIPTVIVVFVIIGLSFPYLTTEHLEPMHQSFRKNWIAFVGVILALSGVEAIANLTGIMKLDPDSSPDHPQVGRASSHAIGLVALEVVLGTALLGWAMLSLPQSLTSQLVERKEDMLRFLGEHYAAMWWGPAFGDFLGVVIGTVIGFLLLSAVNTAIVAVIGLTYMLAQDGEMPKNFAQLNTHGVPLPPLLIATLLPIMVVALTNNFEALAALYAIGVVGAITVNVGSCTFNKKLSIYWFERGVMGLTFFILFAIELTIAKTKPDALFFACCILGGGLGLRAYAQKRVGLQAILIPKEVTAEKLSLSEVTPSLQVNLSPGQKIMVAARGLTPVVCFAIEEARLRQGILYVLVVKEVAVARPFVPMEATPPRWQDDPQASATLHGVLNLAKPHGISIVPLFAISEDPASIILDLAATLGVDFLMLGSSHRRFLTQLLKGDVTAEVARNLPENIQLIIHG